jgi:predicted acetylornithine/succinylornithine family transaminase
MNRNEELIEAARRTLTQNYKQAQLVITRGEGVWLWDADGRRYLDMTAGIAVCSLGHCHRRLALVIAQQAGRLIHASNLYYLETQIELAAALTAISRLPRAFFCNSGGEANEAAIKLARRYQAVVAGRPDRVLLVSTEGSFHGRTMATVALTGQEKYRQNLGPLLEPVRFVPYGDVGAARQVLEDGTACAFLVEPLQAEGGVIVPPPGYLSALRHLCTDTGTLLIFDEVQTGIGRLGQWFGHQLDGVIPDVMTLAKGLAGGVPIGAMLASEDAARAFQPQPGEPVTHASTFGGNPLACAAALAVLETIEIEGLLENCREAGDYLGRGLQRLVDRYPRVAREARGRGLLRGLAVHGDAPAIVAKCRERQLLVSVAGPSTVRFVPALNVRREQVDQALAILEEVVRGT